VTARRTPPSVPPRIRSAKWIGFILLGAAFAQLDPQVAATSPAAAARSTTPVVVSAFKSRVGGMQPIVQPAANDPAKSNHMRGSDGRDGAAPRSVQAGCGISGTVYEMGQPAVGVPLTLVKYAPGVGGSETLSGSASSGPGGVYAFLNVPALAAGEAYYVSFVGNAKPSPSDQRLAAWFTRDISDFDANGCVPELDLDVADAPLQSPAHQRSVPWGTPFTWSERIKAWRGAEDRHQVCFAPPAGGDIIDCVPNPGIAGSSYTPGNIDRPADIDDDTAYGWLLRVSRADGAFGFGRWQREITFVPGTPVSTTPVPPPTDVPPTHDATSTITPRPTAFTPTPDPNAPPTPTATEPLPPGTELLCPGDILRGQLDVFLPEAPTVGDVLFVFDMTGSMQPLIDQATREALAIMANVAGIVNDAQFGVAVFEDYPSLTGGNDTPYALLSPITANRAAVQAAIAGIRADGGGYALNEPYTRALYESYDDPAVGWRPMARSYVILIGDTVPYDDNLNEGIVNPRQNPSGSWCHDAPCHLDPGRDGALGGGDDLDLQFELDEMGRRGKTLLVVGVGTKGQAWLDTMVDYWDQWAKRTGPGGRAVPLNATADLATVISDLIRDAGSRISRLTLEPDPATYATWVVSSPDEYVDIEVKRGGRTVSFGYEIRIPPAAPLDTLHTFVLRAIGDGAEYAKKPISLFLSSAACVPPPTVQPSGHFVIGIPLSAYRSFPGVHVGGGRTVRRGGPAGGRANTALQVQNLDGSQTLNAWAYFFPQILPYARPDGFGRPPAYPKEVWGVPPGASANIYLPQLTLPFGAFSGVMLDDISLPLAGVARMDWTETGAAALYSNVGPSYELTMPLVVRKYYGMTSIIGVMSDGNDRPVRVEMTFFRQGQSSPVGSRYFELQPYEGATFDLQDDDPVFNQLDDGFLGAARLRLVYGPLNRPDTGAQIGAMSYVNIARSKHAIWAFEAVPTGDDNDQSAERLFAPLWRSRQHGLRPGDRLDTGISVVNPGDDAVDALVELYTTTAGSASQACRAAGKITLPRQTIPPHSSHVFYQGPDGRGVTGLPDDCFGSAVIQSMTPGGKLLAIVNDAQNLTEHSAAYNAVPAQRAHTKVAVPLYRRLNGAARLTTGIQVMNTSDRPGRVHIDFLVGLGPAAVPAGGCGPTCDAVIQPMSAHTWWPPAIGALVDGQIGSAIVESDVPIAVIVNDYPLAGEIDAATYTGIPVFDRPVPNPTVRPRDAHDVVQPAVR